MDENRNFAKEVGGQVNKADKQQRDAAKRKKRIKRLIKYAPILLWVLGISIPVIIFLAAISNNLDKKTAMTSKQANLGAVNFSTSATEETSPNRIIVDVNERNTDGAYELSYSFKDKDGNEIPDIEALEKIKLDLLKENGDLDLSKFSDPELNIIGALMYNGLKVEQYNEEELKALVIFLKADIAGQSFDLRPKDQIGQAVALNGLGDNDNVYGTLQVQRVKIEDVNGVLGYKEELLEYIEYGDETTPETFSYMVKNNDASVLNNFTINENGELLYAKSSTTNITYSYSLNGEPLSIEDAQAIIPEENLGEEIHETNITASTPIDYKSRIKTYTASYGLLSDLLETTKNVDFCLELAQVALNSKIVININEETTITDETEIATYDQTTLLYDYVKYEVLGTNSNTSTKITELDRGNERPSESQNEELRKSGWNSSMTPTSSQGSSQGAILTYNWTHNGNNYTLVHTSNRSGNSWVLKREDKITTENSSVLEKNDEGHLINNYTEPSLENEPYTAKEEITYTIQKDTYIVDNTCTLDIGELDTWYAKYKYEYNTPVKEGNKPEGHNTKGSYSELSEGVEVPEADIEKDPHVLAFEQNKKNTYKNQYNEVTCKVTGLTIKQRIKTDVRITYDSESSSITYKFAEEEANLTEGDYKNVIYINNKKEYTSYTQENGVEVPEIGFLYIYDKYITAGIDLYLQDDAENKLFELLESDPQTANSANVIKYLLFVYDGIDRGVTELKLTILDLVSSKAMGVFSAFGSTMTREEFIEAVNNYNGGSSYHRLSNVAGEFYDICTAEQYNVNPCLAFSWACVETAYGGKIPNNNLFGMAVYNGANSGASYSSYGESIGGFCKWVIRNATPGTSDYIDTYSRAEEFATVNSKFNGSPENNGYALFCRYMYLGDTHIVDEPDFNHPAGTDYYIKNGSDSGSGGRYYIYYMYERGGLYEGEYATRCGHPNGSDLTTLQEQADYVQYSVEQRTKIAKTIFGNNCLVGGSIVETAYAVADHFMNSGVDVHYAGDSVPGANPNGRICVNGNIQGAWDLPIEQPEKYGVVCATYVSLTLWQAGLVDEETINQEEYYYNGCTGLSNLLMDSKYANEWQKIENFDELQEGDIVFINGHVFIYIDGCKCLDQNYCVIQSDNDDIRGVLIDASDYRHKFKYGFRYIGN